MVSDLTQKVVVAMYGHYSPRAKVKIGRAEAAIEVVEADVRPLVEKMREALRGAIGGSVGIEQLGNQRLIDDALAEADKFLGKGK